MIILVSSIELIHIKPLQDGFHKKYLVQLNGGSIKENVKFAHWELESVLLRAFKKSNETGTPIYNITIRLPQIFSEKSLEAYCNQDSKDYDYKYSFAMLEKFFSLKYPVFSIKVFKEQDLRSSCIVVKFFSHKNRRNSMLVATLPKKFKRRKN